MPQQTALQSFFENQVCLIVEPSKAFLASIQTCVKSLDLPIGEIILANKYEEAVAFIQQRKPRMLITEYDVLGHNGLSLVELQQQFQEDQNRISIVVSGNSSDSVIAESAEEQVDSFLLKPFSSDDLKKKLLAVIQAKVNPSPYSLKIKEGRTFQQENVLNEAVNSFIQAKQLHEKPSLACFYLGDVYKLLKENKKALTEFQEGRIYHPLHYKCLIGEFEILVEDKDYQRAYELIPILIKNFPLTPRRLTQVFIAAVFSMRFEFLPAYYEQYIKIDRRSPELIKIASLAFFTAGKWYLQNKDVKKAGNFFEKALFIVNRDIDFLVQIIEELIKSQAYEEALLFLTKASPSDVGSLVYNRLSFKIDQFTLRKDQLFERARKFALTGEASLENYKVIIKIFADEGNIPLAESIISKAIASQPELRAELYQILEQNTPPEEK